MKDSFYFSHDVNTRRDPKIGALIQRFGVEGYGIWWGLVEIMHEQSGGKLQKFPKLYEGLSQILSINEAERSKVEALLKHFIPALISDFCLFKEDDNYIWSDRVIRNLEDRKMKRMQRAEAGRLGGIISGEKRSKMKQALQANEANEAKESKVKESKVNIAGENPTLAPTFDEVVEHCKLKKYTFDPKNFYAYYKAKNWISKGDKIVHWKAALYRWNLNESRFTNATPNIRPAL